MGANDPSRGTAARGCANFVAATVDVDSLEYGEALQVVRIEGGIANNVVPDRCTVVVTVATRLRDRWMTPSRR